MNYPFKLKNSSLSLVILSVMFSEMVHSATNFTITPIPPLPTKNSAGGTVIANFTLTNSTSSARNGYRFVDLPPNIVQAVNVSLCQNLINLATGTSCVLQLDVTGLTSYPKITLCKGTSCTQFSLPLNIGLVGSSLLVAVGSSTFPGLSGLPILSQSTDAGQTWVYSSLPALPSAGTSGVLNAVSCIGSSCIAAGEENSNIPLIAVTNDNGQTWQYASVPTPGHDAGLYSVSNVSESTLVAVGQIDTSPTTGYILRSTDGGLTWSLPTSYTPVPGSFRSVSCSGTTCVATGTTGDSSILSPRVLEVSNDGGQTWTDKSNAPNVPNNSHLYAVSCSGSLCVAVGEDLATFNSLALKSTDNGGTWNVQTLPNTFEGGLHAVDCTSTLCVAGGFGNNGVLPPLEGFAQPLIVQSINGGAWTTTYLTTPTASSRYGFHSINCNATRCVAAADNNNFASYEPAPSPPFVGVIAQSTLSGSWVWSNFETLPAGVTNSTYSSASCANQTCFAAGQNEDTASPLIVQSLTSSTSWAYPLLPAGTLGGFIGSGAGQSS